MAEQPNITFTLFTPVDYLQQFVRLCIFTHVHLNNIMTYLYFDEHQVIVLKKLIDQFLIIMTLILMLASSSIQE